MSEKSLKERIIDCSYEMFSSRGIRSVTMDAISAELSISKRTLYEEFSSKNELLICVLNEMNNFSQRQLEKIWEMDISPVEKIFRITSINSERSSKEVLFFQDIVSNFPQLLDRLIKGNYENNMLRMINCLNLGCEGGYFYDNIDFKIVIEFFFDMKIQFNNRKNISMVEMFNMHTLATIFFLRCLSNEKGIEEINRLCKKNNINIYKE